MHRATIASLLFAAAFSAGAADTPALRLNQIQIIGSHNSYRTRPPEALWKFLQLLPPGTGAGDPKDLDYSHPPLSEQFDAGVRSVELDIYADPEGGRFAKRMGMSLAKEPVEAPEPELAELMRPGCKVLHVPDFDFGSTCLSLRKALYSVKSWSEAHPRHVPLIIHFETKDETVAAKVNLPGLTVAAPWDAKQCDALDAEIREAFGADLAKILTPDRLRGTHATLEAAALAGAWPLLDDLRGQVIFVMEGVAVNTYAAEHASLKGRACFIYGKAGRPETAFLLMNDAERQREAIAQRVKEGYLVRTRADSSTTAARTGDTARRDAALASGAQIISSDYFLPDPRGGKEPGWTTYQVQLPGGLRARPNPVSAPDRSSKITE